MAARAGLKLRRCACRNRHRQAVDTLIPSIMKFAVNAALAAAMTLIAAPVHAQSLDLTVNDVGISIGDSRRVTGLRMNFRDRRMEEVIGINATMWMPYEENQGIVRGLALGLPGTGARSIRGVAAALVGVGVHDDFRGIGVGGIGLGVGEDMRGLAAGGIGVGVGQNVRGAVIGGIGSGIGGNMSGLGIGGIGLGIGGNARGLLIGGLGAGVGGDMEGISIAGDWQSRYSTTRERSTECRSVTQLCGQQVPRNPASPDRECRTRELGEALAQKAKYQRETDLTDLGGSHG